MIAHVDATYGWIVGLRLGLLGPVLWLPVEIYVLDFITLRGLAVGSARHMMNTIDVRYLDVADPAFSVRSETVRQAREQSWFARTPYGIAVLGMRRSAGC